MAILEHSIMRLSGERGTVEFDVDPQRDIVKMTVGKEVRTFKFVDLFALTFALASSEQQEKMMPVRHTEVVTYKRIHKVALKKDMKKGEIVKIHCEMNVEKTVVEAMKGLLPERPKSLSFSPSVPIIGAGSTLSPP